MWRVENQTLVATNPDGRGQGAGGRGRLLTERSFKEFIFRFEYQSSSRIWNLRQFGGPSRVRCPPCSNRPDRPSASRRIAVVQGSFRRGSASELKGGERMEHRSKSRRETG